MKKLYNFFATILMLIPCVLFLSACGSESEPEPIFTHEIYNLKQNYYYNQTEIDLIQLELIIYKDGILNDTISIEDNMIIKDVDTSVLGQNDFVVLYNNKNYSQNYYIVLPNELSQQVESIEPYLNPLPTTFYTDYDSSVTNYFEDVKLKVSLNSQAEEYYIVNITQDMISNFTTQTSGNRTAIINYDGKEYLFDYTVNQVIAVELDIIYDNNGNFLKYNYTINEGLDRTGGLLKVYTNSGTFYIISFETDEINFSGFDSTIIGNRAMTISYQDITIDFYYIVSAPVITSIRIQTEFKSSYLIGEALDVTGGTIFVNYDNGTNIIVNIVEEMISNFSTDEFKNDYCYITYEGKVTLFNYAVVTNLYFNEPSEGIQIIEQTIKINTQNSMFNLEDFLSIKSGYNYQTIDENQVDNEYEMSEDGIYYYTVKIYNTHDQPSLVATYNIEVTKASN